LRWELERLGDKGILKKKKRARQKKKEKNEHLLSMASMMLLDSKKKLLEVHGIMCEHMIPNGLFGTLHKLQ